MQDRPDTSVPTAGEQVELIEFCLHERQEDGTLHEGIYGISVSRVRQVEVLPEIEPVPDAHPAVIGLIHSRGEQVPLLHLCRWMHIDEVPPTDTPPKVIVCEVDGHTLGLLVHQASRIRSVPWESVLPPPPLVAQQHGTTISATTRIGGTRTMLVLDIEAIVSGVLGTDEATPEVGARVEPMGKSILVVDDSATVRSRMRRILEGAGYHVMASQDGEEALTHLRSAAASSTSFSPDLLITDVEMPRRSGYDLVRSLRQNSTWETLPIIMQSSLAGEQNEQRGLDAGCDVYLVKFDAEILLATVARLLDR